MGRRYAAAVHILVVEDDAALVRILRKSIESSGHTVETAGDGVAGLEAARAGRFDAIVLDLMLPKMDGVEVCRRIRADGHRTPILMLTARSAVADRIAGLDAGADDYLPKPFALGELAARLRALARRGRTGGEVLRAGDLVLDTGAREVRVGDALVELTGTEFALLEYLLRNPGQVLSRDQLREEVWGSGFEPASNVVDIYIHYLRRKLKAAGLSDPIRTVRGLGYALRQPA
jgi:two-component system, OmpR family, response regulator MprA